jgi:hypothetical protein
MHTMCSPVNCHQPPRLESRPNLRKHNEKQEENLAIEERLNRATDILKDNALLKPELLVLVICFPEHPA